MHQLNDLLFFIFFIVEVMKKLKYEIKQPDIWCVIPSTVSYFKGGTCCQFQHALNSLSKKKILKQIPRTGGSSPHSMQQIFSAYWPQILNWLKHLTFICFLGHLKVKVVLAGKFPLSLHLQHVNIDFSSNFSQLESRSIFLSDRKGTAIRPFKHFQSVEKLPLALG